MLINSVNPNSFYIRPKQNGMISFKGTESLKADTFEKQSREEKIKKDIVYKKFRRLAIRDIDKFRLIKTAITSMVIDKGVSESTFLDFVNELMNLQDTTTLQKAVDANIRFRLIVSDEPSSYSIYNSKDFPTVKEIKICQKSDGTNLVYQLPHELGHVFDYETKIEDNNLTSDLEYDLIKDEEGYKKSDEYLPNTQKPYIDNYEKNNKEIKYRGVILQNASFSKEFSDAFLKDYLNILEIDKKQGLEEGTTFSELLKDWDEESYFGYYLGSEPGESEIMDTSRLRKELFAQICAYSTNGHTARKGFDEKLLLYFPNSYEFVNNLIKKTL